MKNIIRRRRVSCRNLMGVAIYLSLCQWGVVAHADVVNQDLSGVTPAIPENAPQAVGGSELTTDQYGNTFHIGGYLRGEVSFNLQNIPEVPTNTKWQASMIRGTGDIDVDATTGRIKWKVVGRVDEEAPTNYLEELQALRSTNGTVVPGSSIMDNYDKASFREFWGEFKAGSDTTVRIGKQQLVWGESDFFHAMDVVNGYDYSWRLFFEPENEEIRKALFLISLKTNVESANGQIQAYVRPGLDACRDIGNTYDTNGGRWFFQPYRGYDLGAVTTEDCRHPDGNYRTPTGGIRWSGNYDSISYSLAYIRTFSADPVANSAFKPYMVKPAGEYFDLIHPMIDVFGLTLSGYSAPVDSVFSAEMAFTRDQPYNIGTGALGSPTVAGNVGDGLGGVMKKNTLTTMLRADKNFNFEGLLGTDRPSLSSIQLFDTMVLDYQESDDLARLFAYASPLKRHSTLLTAFTALNYNSDTINPTLAVGTDLTNGGGFVIPSVEIVLGDSWRLRVEADLLWASKQSTNLFDTNAPGTQLFGFFANNSQLVFRLTRQF